MEIINRATEHLNLAMVVLVVKKGPWFASWQDLCSKLTNKMPFFNHYLIPNIALMSGQLMVLLRFFANHLMPLRDSNPRL